MKTEKKWNKTGKVGLIGLGLCLMVGVITMDIARAGHPAHSVNFALGKTVAAKGQFFTGGWGDGAIVDFSTLTDATVFEKGHQWDQGPIWWQEDMDEIQNSLTVYLGPTSVTVRKLVLQVDNNDDYIISWQDDVLGYREVSVVPNRHWGMDVPTVVVLPIGQPAKTKAFTIKHDARGAGDGWYSVSDFKALK